MAQQEDNDSCVVRGRGRQNRSQVPPQDSNNLQPRDPGQVLTDSALQSSPEGRVQKTPVVESSSHSNTPVSGRTRSKTDFTDECLINTFPMIEVSNPNINPGAPTSMLVYRTWTLEDVKKTVEGIPHPKADLAGFISLMSLLQVTYHLNGVEVQQAFMAKLGIDWARVQGNLNPMTTGQNPEGLPHGGGEITGRITALFYRVKITFKKRADYTAVNQIKQEPDESVTDFMIRLEEVLKQNSGLVDDGDETGPYRQQLKNALQANAKPNFSNWVRDIMWTYPRALSANGRTGLYLQTK